ncbi:MAG: hypothetical protein QG626_689 [Patescibacteria group bacterium]|nr:hypothetical protein [Patescibacteria group bacterium]
MRGLARVIVAEAEGKTPAQLELFMKETIAYLAERGMLGRWRDLERDIHEAWKEKFGVSKITIATAHPLTGKTKTILQELAQGAELQEVVDERLMGGALIRMDERRIDGTVLGSLTRLKQALLS